MIDVKTRQVYYTPIYYLLAQFSKTIRPGDKAIQTTKYTEGLDDDALHTSATIAANAIQTVRVQL